MVSGFLAGDALAAADALGPQDASRLMPTAPAALRPSPSTLVGQRQNRCSAPDIVVVHPVSLALGLRHAATPADAWLHGSPQTARPVCSRATLTWGNEVAVACAQHRASAARLAVGLLQQRQKQNVQILICVVIGFSLRLSLQQRFRRCICLVSWHASQLESLMASLAQPRAGAHASSYHPSIHCLSLSGFV